MVVYSQFNTKEKAQYNTGLLSEKPNNYFKL
jgi:hypothetical protein